jgi:hypothetical protein
MHGTGKARPGRRAVAALLLLTQGACLSSPQPVGAPAPYLQEETPKRIWVSLVNGDEMVIDGPRVYGDTLLGFTEKEGVQEEVWMPLSNLREVKAKHVSGVRTALLGAAIAASVGLLVISIPTEGGNLVRPCMNEGVPCEDA